ncbi:PTS system mannose/fructose/sorbose family transporter subunit IID [Heyndrickxia coagulans]|jgi:mannose/fructose/N-acetylgalactosamine-specific phosphotransferase system component IID|uniref:PTS system mannose/fructose/sorbose family transporter subunit IID n=1 Tax=Heyndrickxia coagulans TaxID=1398 RepID=UPI0007790B8A|nr:PTS system mannose/fructose/sorbose family transporter subunit IID [Heyndrickxia coagulans]APB37435.1 PTS mannose transporter subunit IID [Heyndrickxia coagulans]KYC89541.1 PTS system, gluconate-specific IID component [Heyndrickxia coagulans]QPG53237.1 PTS system mannose/fructose/sorbose family transporter subunit IID [Heyndrickxia coagulans]WNE61262.1 PTS system mannose/fructose/sorbose family transporter subunit IID [Heyndrickxia coagulans]
MQDTGNNLPKQSGSNLEPEQITNKDVSKSYLRWHFANEIPHSFDRYLAASLLWAMMPILRKLYKDDEALRAAYKRQLLFFNTQLTWGGGIITGLMSSMEQERAREEYNREEIKMTDDLMYNTKAGLMGALAGIGDSIDSGTIQYIFIAIAIPWAQHGSALGALFPFICFATYQVLIGLFFARQGFTRGRNATTLMQSSGIQNIIDLLSILGLFMMGILAGNYVKVSSSLKFELSGREFNIQETLNSILPGMLPLAVVLGVYWYYTKKGLKVTQALIWLTVILGVLAAVRIL